MNSNISIFVNSKEVPDFLEVSATADFSNVGNVFVFTHNRDVADCGDSVVIKCGGQIFMVGFVMRKKKKLSKNGGSTFEFNGVDRLGFLGNCQVFANAQYSSSAADIAKKIISNLDNASDYNIVEVGESSIEDFSVAAGESVGQCLARLSVAAGKFVYGTRDGHGTIEFAGAAKSGGSRIEKFDFDEKEIGYYEIEDVEIEESIEGGASVIYGRTQLYSPDDAPVYNIKRSVPGNNRVCMPNYLSAPTKKELEAIIQRRYEEIVSGMLSIKLKLAGCISPCGSVWRINSRLRLSANINKEYDGTYNIRSAEVKKDKKGGTSSTVTLSKLPAQTVQKNDSVSEITNATGVRFTPAPGQNGGYDD
jgi:prophage tail gpP-like protein